MAAAISPELGKTCAPQKKYNEQKNGGIIGRQMGWQGGTGCVAADVKRCNIRCLPSPFPLAEQHPGLGATGTGGVWNGANWS